LRLIVGGVVAAGLALVFLALTARPVTSAVAAVTVMAIVVIVSNVKLAALREPLVFVDFGMIGEIASHPQLFVPYLGVLPTIAIVLAVAASVWAVTAFESPMPALLGQWPVLRLAGALALIAALVACIYWGHRRLATWGWRLKPSLDPATDIERFGLFGSLVLTGLLSIDATGKDVARQSRRRDAAKSWPAERPNIVAVQMESFFDARLMDPRIDRRLLSCFDACAENAVQRGRLEVPACGYTQRTEFAFLTGLGDEELGLDRYNPYARFARRPVWSIAHELRAAGYRTVCVHPFFGAFFGRHQVIPNLGFDQFLDIAAFAGAARFGPYISDQSLADKIGGLLAESETPLFVYAITMENHGGWGRGRLPASELASLREALPDLPPGFLCYLRHLANADRMVGRLAASLDQTGGGILCVFGDHLPSFTELFRRSGFADPRTDYFVWRSDYHGPVVGSDMPVRALSQCLLSVAQTPRTSAESRLAAG